MTPEEEKELDEKYSKMGQVFEHWDKPLIQKWFKEQDEKTQRMTLSMKQLHDAMKTIKTK